MSSLQCLFPGKENPVRYITEQELRDLFIKGIPTEYVLPKDAKLTPAARQYLIDLRLFRSETGKKNCIKANGLKPEHMTHLNTGQLVHKTHPRIALRGKLDSLEAEILLVEIQAKERGALSLIPALEDALALTRRILAAEVTGKPLGEWLMVGQTPDQIHQASHHPQSFGFRGHVLPGAEQGMVAALLNRLRTQVREAELAAAAAFCQGEGPCNREDLLMALNRLSSYFYVLQLQAIKGQE